MPLRLESATPSDIPDLVAIYFATFKSPIVRRLKPDVPSSREWYARNLESAFEKSHHRIYKVVDDVDGVKHCHHHREHEGSSRSGVLPRGNAGGGGLSDAGIVAFAMWNLPSHKESSPGGGGGGPAASWPKDGDPMLFEQIVAQATSLRKELVGEKQHWYLAVLATLPQHQRRGAASLLLAEFCRQMDGAGQWGYLEASPAGKSTYERFGFAARGSFSTWIDGEEYVDSCMVRDPR